MPFQMFSYDLQLRRLLQFCCKGERKRSYLMDQRVLRKRRIRICLNEKSLRNESVI